MRYTKDMSNGYSTQVHRDESDYVTVLLDGRTISPRVHESRVDQFIADHAATIERRKATVAAYEAAGMKIIRDCSDMPRAARFRHMNRVAVLDTNGEIVAHYASLDEVPALEAPEADAAGDDQGNDGDDTEAQAETTEAPATVRGTITDTQIETIMDLIHDGAHEEGGFYSGPTTRAGVEAMTREDASTYITSLKGDY